METLKEISFPFPIADADTGPILTWNHRDLVLEFTDSTGSFRRALFQDVPYYHFNSIDDQTRVLEDERFYTVPNSSVIESLFNSKEIASKKDYIHTIICFSSIDSFLEVIYKKMQE